MTLVTYTGRVFDFKDITKDSIHIPDILYALPKINRYLGHTSRRYNVAEHTLLGLSIAEKYGYTNLQKLHWFKHDFTEAYMGDCPTPLKKMIPMYKEIEKKVSIAIDEHLGLKPMTEQEKLLVKRVDNTMLILEMRDLTRHDYSKYLCNLTYSEVLEDNSFKIGGKPWDDKLLTDLLTLIFNNLMEGIK